MRVGYDVRGLAELREKLASLDNDMKKRGGRVALRKAAQVIRDQARQNAKRVDDTMTPEDIAKNIVERWSSRFFRKTGGDMMFRVGILGGASGYASAAGEVKGKGAGNPGGDTYYWRFLEFGTYRTRAKPFMRPAMDQAGQGSVDAYIRSYGEALDRILRTTARKSSKGAK